MRELIHKTDGGQIEVSQHDVESGHLGGIEVCFRDDGGDLIDIAQVLYNKKKQCLEILVYSDPSDDDYTDKFEIKIRDIEDAMGVPF